MSLGIGVPVAEGGVGLPPYPRFEAAQAAFHSFSPLRKGTEKKIREGLSIPLPEPTPKRPLRGVGQSFEVLLPHSAFGFGDAYPYACASLILALANGYSSPRQGRWGVWGESKRPSVFGSF